MSAIISSDALANKRNSEHLRVIDASWHMPSEKRGAFSEYQACHIPGAVFFDLDVVSDQKSPYPHMLPSAESFAAEASRLGIANDDDIVVYDTSGLFSAARVWWMFRVFGHDKVWVLDGGLPQWKAEGKTLEAGKITPSPTQFVSRFRPDLLRSRRQIADNISYPREMLLDARSSSRFLGTEPEPRPGLRSGHIPGSINIHYKELLLPPYNTLRPLSELRSILQSHSVDPAQPLAATCGSGVTACILALALYELGNGQVAIYDGAWSEWGSLPPEN